MKRLLGSPFVLDQAVSSVITFVLVAALSRSGGPALVGSVAILQTIALTGLAAARAIGVDVWAARGGSSHARRAALAPSFFVAGAVFLINMAPLLVLGEFNSALTLYWLASPLVVLMDGVRILLLHANRSWISVFVQSGTLTILLAVLVISASSYFVLGSYLLGTALVIIVGLIRLRIVPPVPSLRYSFENRTKSGPFLVEISLGSIMQQALFLLLAILSSVEAAGRIRIAQTLLGPMSVIHAGLAPQLLRKLGQTPAAGPRKIATAGRNFGLKLAAASLTGALALSVLLPLEVAGGSLLEILTGQQDLEVPLVLAICGVALSSGALILGTGTAARILGLTAVLNKWRLWLVLPQVLAVALLSSTSTENAVAAASGLAISTTLTALMSVLIISRAVGRGNRRAKSD